MLLKYSHPGTQARRRQPEEPRKGIFRIGFAASVLRLVLMCTVHSALSGLPLAFALVLWVLLGTELQWPAHAAQADSGFGGPQGPRPSEGLDTGRRLS